MLKRNWAEWKVRKRLDLDITSSLHQHFHTSSKPISLISWAKPPDKFIKINFNRSKSSSFSTILYISPKHGDQMLTPTCTCMKTMEPLGKNLLLLFLILPSLACESKGQLNKVGWDPFEPNKHVPRDHDPIKPTHTLINNNDTVEMQVPNRTHPIPNEVSYETERQVPDGLDPIHNNVSYIKQKGKFLPDQYHSQWCFL